MTETLYLDSNIFIYAFSDDQQFGKLARQLLSAVKDGEKKACTSSITFNEGMHVLRKITTFEDSVTFGEHFLGMENLRILELNSTILYGSLELIKKYRLRPSDAIHIATALAARADTFYTQDSDLKKIKEIHIRSL